MGHNELEKSKAYKLMDILEYLPDSVVIHPIFIKNTGSISVVSYDAGVKVIGKKSAFDAFIQIIDGEAEIIIGDQSHFMETGQVIIIPAHSTNTMIAKGRFKILSTIIKSGYEDVSL